MSNGSPGIDFEEPVEGQLNLRALIAAANEAVLGTATDHDDWESSFSQQVSGAAEYRSTASGLIFFDCSEVPYQILQSGPVSCPLLSIATTETAWVMLEQLGSGDLTAHASMAVGHSQGIAHAVGMPRTCRELYRLPRMVHALFLQGCVEQYHVGLRHFEAQGDAKQRKSGMAMLQGAPHEMLESDHGAGSVCIINSETSAVCSGNIAPRLLKRLARDEKVSARALPIPFPAHSRELQPALHHLRERLRTHARLFDDHRDQSRESSAAAASPSQALVRGQPSVASAVLPVHPLSGGLRLPDDMPGSAWNSVAASQLTDAMDFPAALVSASSFLEPSDAIDCGPCRASVTFRLVEQSSPDFEVISAVAVLSKPALQLEDDEAAAPSLITRIQDVASRVLGVDRIPENTPLVKVGLNSLNLMPLRSRLLADIPESAGFLTSRVLLDCATIGSIASFLAERSSTEQLAIADRSPVGVFPPISHLSVYVSPGQTYPLSFGQEQMLRLQSTYPQMTAYNISSSCWIAGGLDPEWLRRCLTRVISRHEVFGTTAVLNPPCAQMRAVEPSVRIIHVQDEAAALGRLAEVGRTPFHLGEESSLRAEILVDPEGLILLSLWIHHMNHDIMSQGILLRDLHMLLCSPNPSSVVLPELAVQYADFAYWSRQCAARGLYDVTSHLKELVPHSSLALDLPLDFPRPQKWTFRGDRVTTRLADDLELPMEGMTPFMVFLAAFFIQLSKSSGQEAVIIGVPYHGRDQAILEPLCGYFVNMVPVVNELRHGTTVEEALQNVRERWMRAAEHASVPFLYLRDHLMQKHGFRSDPSRNPIFQAMLNYRKDAVQPLHDERFLMQPVHQVEAHMDFDIMIDQDASGGTLITHNYCIDLFKPRTAERFAGQYLAVLRAITTPYWSRVDVWRLPPTLKAVRDVEESPAMSPERYREELGPMLQQLGLLGAKKPIVVDRSSTGAIMVGAG